MSVCVCVCLCLHVVTTACDYARVHVHVYLHVCMYMCVCACVFVCTRVCVCVLHACVLNLILTSGVCFMHAGWSVVPKKFQWLIVIGWKKV